MIKPLRDPASLARVFVELGAPSWPNSTAIDPEALHSDMTRAGPLTPSAA
jgi:hypothetical protein